MFASNLLKGLLSRMDAVVLPGNNPRRKKKEKKQVGHMLHQSTYLVQQKDPTTGVVSFKQVGISYINPDRKNKHFII